MTFLCWKWRKIQQKLLFSIKNTRMDYVRHGEIQGRTLVFFKSHSPCILPCLRQSMHYLHTDSIGLNWEIWPEFSKNLTNSDLNCRLIFHKFLHRNKISLSFLCDKFFDGFHQIAYHKHCAPIFHEFWSAQQMTWYYNDK